MNKYFKKIKLKVRSGDEVEKTVIKTVKKTPRKASEFTLFSSYASFSTKKQTFFAKRLSFLIRAGVPMLESIHVIKEQTKSKGEIRIYEKIITDVSNGQTLSNSLRKFKKVFGNFTINVVKAGESSGTLIQNLNYLADELKKKEILRKKIMSALLYPAIITVATFSIVGFLTIYIFPKIMPIFSSMSVKLPFTTRAIIWFSSTMKEHWLIIFLMIAAIIIIIVMSIRLSTKVRYAYDGFLMRLPIFGGIVKNYNLTNTMRTLGLLLRSGTTFTEALIVTSETTDNVRYKEAFVTLSEGIMKGKGMSELIMQFPFIFPPMLKHMISIGEKSGNLSNTLTYLSEYYEHEFEEQTKNLSSTIEPVLMIVMGVLVGFVAISVIAPIYELTSNLQNQ